MALQTCVEFTGIYSTYVYKISIRLCMQWFSSVMGEEPLSQKLTILQDSIGGGLGEVLHQSQSQEAELLDLQSQAALPTSSTCGGRMSACFRWLGCRFVGSLST